MVTNSSCCDERNGRFSKNRRPYSLYCVGADVKPCSINQSDSVVGSIMLQSHVCLYILTANSCTQFAELLRERLLVVWQRVQAVLVDMEEGVVSEVMKSPLCDVFDHRQLITDVSGSGNNWFVLLIHVTCVYILT